MGWQGVMNIVRENSAERMLGRKKTQSRVSYLSLLDTLAEVDEVYLSPGKGVVTEGDIAEGHRLAWHLAGIGMRFFLEQDPSRPRLERLVTPSLKMMGDNPDALYYFAGLNLSSTRGEGYTLTGTYQGETYMSVTLYAADSPAGFAQRVVSEMNLSAMKLRKDNSFAIRLTKTDTGGLGSWMMLNEAVTCIVTRHYFENPGESVALDGVLAARIESNFIITNNGKPNDIPTGLLDDHEMARRLDLVSEFIRAHSTGRNQDPTKAPPWFSFTPNVIGQPALWSNPGNDENRGMGAPDIAYGAGYFKLNPKEALEITGMVPECAFGNVVLWNRYLQSLDYRHRRTSLNRKQMNLDEFGRYRIWVSAQKPTNPGVLTNVIETHIHT
ncbi:hypothetical protein AAMO2058_000925500 [Amorphochlora amoebiformis]